MSTEADNTPQLNDGGDRKVASTSSPRPFWIGAIVALLGAVWLWGASGLPQGARYAAVGPGMFVTVAGLGLLILGILLIIQVARGERFEPQDAEDAAANAPMDKIAFATALLAVILPVLLMRPIGMPLTLTLSFVLVTRAMGSRRPLMDLLTGAILTTIAFALFRRLGLQLRSFFGELIPQDLSRTVEAGLMYLLSIPEMLLAPLLQLLGF